MPESLEQLDLLLKHEVRARKIRRDGVHFQGLRYLSLTLAAYIGEDATIRNDARDMGEIRVSTKIGSPVGRSLPKSVSLTALVGRDDEVREAHRKSVAFALNELESYTQARIGGNQAPETTGQFVAATFEHDTARPVGGYAAPQLHTHAVIFNMTEREDGTMRALQPRSLFETQQFATAVYQSHLTYQLRTLGYEVEPGRSGAPEIKGYSQGYLDASSPRRQQIMEAVTRSGFSGPEAA